MQRWEVTYVRLSHLKIIFCTCLIRSDKVHIEHLRRIFKALLESSRVRGKKLNADLFGYFVDILEARFDAYFADLLKNSEQTSVKG